MTHRQCTLHPSHLPQTSCAEHPVLHRSRQRGRRAHFWMAKMKAGTTSVFCPPESCSSDFISLWRPVKETWGGGGGGGGGVGVDTTHSAIVPSHRMVVVGVAHVPTCMATPSYVSAMFSTREAPLALLSESCREGLVLWTQTTMTGGTVRCSPQPSPSSSSQVVFSSICLLRETALQISL